MGKHKGKVKSVSDVIWQYLIIDGLLGILKLLWSGFAWVGKGIAKVFSGMMDSSH